MVSFVENLIKTDLGEIIGLNELGIERAHIAHIGVLCYAPQDQRLWGFWNTQPKRKVISTVWKKASPWTGEECFSTRTTQRMWWIKGKNICKYRGSLKRRESDFPFSWTWERSYMRVQTKPSKTYKKGASRYCRDPKADWGRQRGWAPTWKKQEHTAQRQRGIPAKDPRQALWRPTTAWNGRRGLLIHRIPA